MFASIDDLEAGLAQIADRGRHLPHPGLHLGTRGSAGAGRRRQGAGGADRPPRRRLHHPGPHRLSAQGHRGAGPPDRGQRGLAQAVADRLRRGRGGHLQRCRRAPVRADHGPAACGGTTWRGRRRPFVFLSVGGIEPRKGSVFLVRAMALLAREEIPRRPWSSSVVIRSRITSAYRDEVLATLSGLGLELGRDVILAGSLATTSCTSGTAVRTRWSSPRSRRDGVSPCSRQWPPTSRWFQRHRRSPRVPHAGPDRSDDPGRRPEVARGGYAPTGDGRRSARVVGRGGRDLTPAFSWPRAARDHALLYAALSGDT